MSVEQQLALIELFDEVDQLLIQEQNKLLNSGIAPDLNGHHPNERWKTLRSIQLDKEAFQDSYNTSHQDAWSFESKYKIGEKRRNELLQRLRDYRTGQGA